MKNVSTSPPPYVSFWVTQTPLKTSGADIVEYPGMLRETPNVRQIQGEPPRRWFADEFFDLIVWLEADGSVSGFQLCYDREFLHAEKI